MTPCSSVKVNGRFEETCRLPFQGRRVRETRSLCEADMKQFSCSFLVLFTIWTRWWRNCVPPKLRFTLPDGTALQPRDPEVELLMVTVVTIRDPTRIRDHCACIRKNFAESSVNLIGPMQSRKCTPRKLIIFNSYKCPRTLEKCFGHKIYFIFL